MKLEIRIAIVAGLLAGCASSPSQESIIDLASPAIADLALPASDAGGVSGPLGARVEGDSLVFRVRSDGATRIEVNLYSAPTGVDESVRLPLNPDPATRIFSGRIAIADLEAAGVAAPYYYGYRAFGPNWPFDAAWTRGSTTGFGADVDGAGNRFNPNKLLFDPYARELSQDPQTAETLAAGLDGTLYGAGAPNRARDSGRYAPKSIVVDDAPGDVGPRPTRALADDVIYEVHLRGLTMQDGSQPVDCRGTFRGAAARAQPLHDLGITAVELLPIQEFQDDTNGLRGPGRDNYWGYSPIAWFAPDRRYACDRSPGGPTREFQSMVKAFHDAGIKVFVDVVYNHTGEGGVWDKTGEAATLYSLRGIDNAGYYELANDPKFYQDNTGCCGANVGTAHPLAADLVVDSLRYLHEGLGVDGFRFDLAPIVGNRCARGCFDFGGSDAANLLQRIARELPARPEGGGDGVDLIAEPWASGAGTYQLGRFPKGWADWNDVYRDAIRNAQNRLGMVNQTPRQIAQRLLGSPDLFAPGGRKPSASINYIVSHDGYCLRDLYSYGDTRQIGWDQGGDPAMQRQAARTGLAILLLSVGVPMITGGDEMFRTQMGNANPYNVDSPVTWLDYANQTTFARFFDFARRLIHFRTAHPALRPRDWTAGKDGDGNGLKEVTLLDDQGREASTGYLDDASRHFIAWRFDGAPAKDPAASIVVAWNGWSGKVTFTLPKPLPGRAFYRAGNTAAAMEPEGNFTDEGQEKLVAGPTLDVDARSVQVLIER